METVVIEKLGSHGALEGSWEFIYDDPLVCRDGKEKEDMKRKSSSRRKAVKFGQESERRVARQLE